MEDSSAIEGFTGIKVPVGTFQYAMFEGTEQEGPMKGLHTLFIAGYAPVHSIREQILEAAKTKPYKQLYFGAAGRFDYSYASIVDLSEFLFNYKTNAEEDLVVTVENPTIDFSLMDKIPYLYWMCPTVWHGKAVPKGLLSLKVAKELNLHSNDRVLVKIDTGDMTFVTRLNDFAVSDYKDYSGDKLLLTGEI